MNNAYVPPNPQILLTQETLRQAPPFTPPPNDELEWSVLAVREILQENGLDVEITASVSSPQAIRLEMSLGPGVTLEALGQLGERFAEKLNRFGAIRMLLPIPGRDRAGIEIPVQNRYLFPAELLFVSPAWQNAQGELPLLLGWDARELFTLDLATGSHLLIAGYDGAGKSNLLRQFLVSLLAKCSPDQTKFLFYEAKGDTFKPFAGLPHLLVPQAKDPENCLALLEWCVQETKRRRKLLAQAGTRKLAEYRNLPGKDPIPQVLFLLDEIAALLTPQNKNRFHELLQGLDDAGNVGIHLIIATATLPDDALLGSFTFRVCGYCPQATLSQALLGEDGAEALLGKGDLILKLGDNPVRCQSGTMTPEFCQAMASRCSAQRPAKHDAALQKFLQESVESQKARQQAQKQAAMPPPLHFTEPTANDALKAVLAAGKATPQVVSAALGVSAERATNLLDELTFHEYMSAPDASGERAIQREKLPPEFLGKAVTTRKTLESLLQELARKISEGDPASRTVAEYNKGVHAIGKKIVEEAAEVWMAAEYEGPENTSLEISQLFYHLLVLMLKKQISLEDIYKQL